MVSKTLYQSRTVEWSTPEWLFDDLNSKFHFTLTHKVNCNNRRPRNSNCVCAENTEGDDNAKVD